MIAIPLSAGRALVAAPAALLLVLAAFGASRRMRRSTSPYPHPAHPLALQEAVTQAIVAARAQGHLPPDLHGTFVILLRTTAEGVVAELSVQDEPPLLPAVRAVAEAALRDAVRDTRAIPKAVTHSYYSLTF
jgi:hypothetical protein